MLRGFRSKDNRSASVRFSSRQPACAAPDPICRIRGPRRRFSRAGGLEGDLVIGPAEQFVDVGSADAGPLQLAPEPSQQLVDPLVNLLLLDVKRGGDLR